MIIFLAGIVLVFRRDFESLLLLSDVVVEVVVLVVEYHLIALDDEMDT
jgi:hypothetical protein